MTGSMPRLALVGGLAIAVVKDDSVVYARGFGVRRLGDAARVTPQAYGGTYRLEMYGEVVVAAESGALVMRFGPYYTGDLTHWHFDTFQTKWRDPEQGSDRVTFGLNAEGSVGHLRWPGFGKFTRDPAHP